MEPVKGASAATVKKSKLKFKRRDPIPQGCAPQLTQIGRENPKAIDYRGSRESVGAAAGVTPLRMVTTSWMRLVKRRNGQSAAKRPTWGRTFRDCKGWGALLIQRA